MGGSKTKGDKALLSFLAHLSSCNRFIILICLRRVAGLNQTKARSLIEWREKRGPFINRNQLKFIKGLGDKSFQQCAGFLRINHSDVVIE